MTGRLDYLLKNYDVSNPKARENAVREVIQEMTLYGLSQTDFFDRAAFMGGTDLRIFHGLNRFSEVLDFILREPYEGFSFAPYTESLEDTLTTFGIDFKVEAVEKKHQGSIREGLVKANTKELYLKFYSDEDRSDKIYPTQLSKIKMEVDTDPAEGAQYEKRFKTQPFGYMLTSCDMPTMFAGKIHAILCRPWANRFKGRDLYDYIFYLNNGVPYNLAFLNSKMRRTIPDMEGDLSHADVMELLNRRFKEIDYKSAIEDVSNFIGSEEYNSVRIWCPEMFEQITVSLKSCIIK